MARNPGIDPGFLGSGAYPAVSPETGWWLFARPPSVDAVVDTIAVLVGITVCVQEHVDVTAR